MRPPSPLLFKQAARSPSLDFQRRIFFHSLTEIASSTPLNSTGTTDKKQDHTSSTLFPETRIESLAKVENSPVQLDMQQLFKQNSGLEYDRNGGVTLSGDRQNGINKADINDRYLSSNLHRKIQEDPRNMGDSFGAVTNVRSEIKNVNREPLSSDAVEKGSIEACKRTSESCQNINWNSEKHGQVNSNIDTTKSPLTDNTMECQDLCSIKRPMNSFILYSKDNRKKVCA